MKSLIITESDFNKVVPWWRIFIPFSTYAIDAMILGHYGELEYGYNNVENLPKLYRKLVKNG